MNDTMIERMVVRLLALSLFAAPLAGQTAGGPSPGGFEVGDQILLEVEGDTQFTHAFSVGAGPALSLPVILVIPPNGVQRADGEPYFKRRPGPYLQTPRQEAQVLESL